MSTRQNKKRKGRNNVNNRERTVTTFTEDPNTSFLVPLSSEDPPAVLASPFSPSSFSMPYQNYIQPQQQQQFYQPAIPPGKNDLEILENLKTIIKDGQHEFYRAVPQPAALASLYVGHISQQARQDQHPQEYPTPRFSQDPTDGSNGPDRTPQSANNTVEAHTPLSGADTSPIKLGADTLNHSDSSPSAAKSDPDDTTQGPSVDTKTDAPGEYGTRQPLDTASSNKAISFDTTKDDQEPSQLTGENAWERRTLDDRKVRYDDRNPNLPSSRPSTYDSTSPNGTTTSTAPDARLPPPDDRRFHDRDRDRFIDRGGARDWDRDRDRHDSIRDVRDRDRERDVRDRRPDFFGRSYGRSHAPRPPPELRHYEPSYGPDYVPPRRYDTDDRRGGPRSASLDDRSKPPPFDDKRSPFDDHRPPPPSATVDDRRLTLDDRPIRPLPNSGTRALPPNSEDRARLLGDSIPLTRATTEDDRSALPTSLTADDRPRPHVPLEERLSQQAAPTPSLQDRLSQPVPAAVPARVDIATAPSLEERLSLGPVPPRVYARAVSVAREDLHAPLHKDDPRDHDRVTDFRTNRDFSRERPGGPLPTASTYRPDLDRSFGDRYDRDRRDRDVANVDAPPARFGDTFSRAGPLPPRRYSPPPPMFDRDRERERGRAYYPTRSPPPFRGEGVYDPDGERRYATDRERDAYEQRRRDWYAPGDDDKRGLAPQPPVSWRPHEKPPFMERDRDRFYRERERDRDVRERDRDRDLGGLPPPPPPPIRGQWDDRDRRGGFPLSPPLSRMDTTGGVGPGRSLSARLTDPYPPPQSGASGNDERAYLPPPRDFDRGRYGGSALDDHTHAHAHGPPLPFTRVRGRSPSPPRRGPGLAEDMRPPMKRVREDNGPGYAGIGLGVGGGPAYSPPRRGGVGMSVNVGGGMGGAGAGAGEYAPGPPPSSTATTSSAVTSVSGTIPPRSTGTRTPPVSAPLPSSGASGAFYERGGVADREREREREQRERERDRERERERERESYVRGEYGMGYDRDGRGRRSPPLLGSRMGPGPGSGGGYGRGVVGDRRDDRRYVPPPPPPRTN